MEKQTNPKIAILFNPLHIDRDEQKRTDGIHPTRTPRHSLPLCGSRLNGTHVVSNLRGATKK